MRNSIYIVVFLMIACNSKSTLLSTRDLYPVDQIDSFGDSIYVHMCQDIEAFGDGFIATDPSKARVLILDSMLKLTQIIGKKGKGPGELNGPVAVIYEDEILWVFDNLNKTIVKMSKGSDESFNYEREYKYPSGTTLNASRAAVYKNKLLFVPTPFANTIVSMMDLLDSNKVIGLFPTKEVTLRNATLLYIVTQSRLISVGKSSAIVDLYDLSGKRLFEYDLKQELEELQVMARFNDGYYRQNKYKPSILASLITDISYKDPFLYILIAQIPEEIDPNTLDINNEILASSAKSYKIFRYQIGSDRLLLDEVYRLHTSQENVSPHFISFAINDLDEILAYEWD